MKFYEMFVIMCCDAVSMVKVNMCITYNDYQRLGPVAATRPHTGHVMLDTYAVRRQRQYT